MPIQNKFSVLAYCLAGIIVVLLAIGGFVLISQSNDMYEKSLSYTDRFFKESDLRAKAAMVPIYSVIKDGYTEALLYFTLALGVACLAILLPRLQNINIGSSGISLTLKDLPKKVDDLIKQTNAIQAGSTGVGGMPAAAPAGQPRDLALAGPAEDEKVNVKTGDPQKGKWGGVPKRDGLELAAQATYSSVTSFYRVVLTVKSVDDRTPLTGLVHFHLHNSFRNPDPIIMVQDGMAALTLTWVTGAFTVGAEANGGQTLLELDLTETIRRAGG